MTTLRTLAYPFAVKNGSLALSEDFDTIRDAIFSVLECRPGERIMRPRFGSPDFVFDSVQHPQAVISRIQTALEEQIPDVEFVVSGEIKDDGAFNVQINWIVEQMPQAPIQFMLQSENSR
jgi:phage baseplate assembly protein W